MIQCPSCYVGYFSGHFIGLCLPSPLLKYLINYITFMLQTNQAPLPLHKVFHLLQEGGTELPDSASVLPFSGLYALVTLKPLNKLLPHEQELVITTPHLPKLSLIQDDHFDIAPPGTSPHAYSAARIFDVMALRDTTPTFEPGQIPLFPSHPDYGHSRFWRLPINPGVVLSVMLQHLPTAPLNDVGIALTMHLSGLLSIVAARRMLNATGLTNVTGNAQYGAGYAGGPSEGAGNEVRQSAERNTGEAEGRHDSSTVGAGGELDYGLGIWVDELDTGSNQSELSDNSTSRSDGWKPDHWLFNTICPPSISF